MPTAIITKTVKGKGVSFMENQVGWHGKAPNDEDTQLLWQNWKRQVKRYVRSKENRNKRKLR